MNSERADLYILLQYHPIPGALLRYNLLTEKLKCRVMQHWNNLFLRGSIGFSKYTLLVLCILARKKALGECD